MSFQMFQEVHHVLADLPKYKTPWCRALKVPENGLYVHYETGERFKDSSGASLQRIVRVGTHYGQGRLRNRLTSHYKPTKSWASSFFNQVEKAYSNSYDIQAGRNWSSLNYEQQDRKILKYLTGNFQFSVLSIPDLDKCEMWERKLIATLAPYSYQLASKTWLGRHHTNEDKNSRPSRIPQFGLWNVQGTSTNSFVHEMNEKDLNELRRLVARSSG